MKIFSLLLGTPKTTTTLIPNTSSMSAKTTENPFKWANLQEFQNLWSFHLTTTPKPKVSF